MAPLGRALRTALVAYGLAQLPVWALIGFILGPFIAKTAGLASGPITWALLGLTLLIELVGVRALCRAEDPWRRLSRLLSARPNRPSDRKSQRSDPDRTDDRS